MVSNAKKLSTDNRENYNAESSFVCYAKIKKATYKRRDKMKKKEFFKLTPFKMQVLQNFPFIVVQV